MMVMYGSIYTVTFLILGALLPVPTLGAKQESPPDPCLSIAKEPLENSALEPCVGPSCLRWCDGNCKSRCGPNETVGLGYCGRGCKCCQTKFPSCQKSCGSGGNCRNAAISKPSCPPGEKVISGNCGSTISCVCCGRDQPTGCLGRCATSRGSGTCRRTCGFGEVRLGRCPGGKCSCCRPRIPSVCSGICKTGNQWGSCSTVKDCRYPDFPALETQETSRSHVTFIPVPTTCDRGCICCPFRQGPLQ